MLPAVCLPGYGVQGGGWPCQVCQVGSFSPGGTGPCKPCPPGTTTLVTGQSSCGEYMTGATRQSRQQQRQATTCLVIVGSRSLLAAAQKELMWGMQQVCSRVQHTPLMAPNVCQTRDPTPHPSPPNPTPPPLPTPRLLPRPGCVWPYLLQPRSV
jgi:hypothetical protein